METGQFVCLSKNQKLPQRSTLIIIFRSGFWGGFWSGENSGEDSEKDSGEDSGKDSGEDYGADSGEELICSDPSAAELLFPDLRGDLALA